MKRVAGFLLLLGVGVLPVFPQKTEPPIETTICEITQHPFRFYGKRVRLSVQHVADRNFGDALVDFPGTLNLKQPEAFEQPCFIAYGLAENFRGGLPFLGDQVPTFLGKASRFPDIGFWGASGIVVGEIHSNPKPRVEPTVVRDGNGKIIKVNFFLGSGLRLRGTKLNLRLDIASFSEF